jgi:hypothetical protein
MITDVINKSWKLLWKSPITWIIVLIEISSLAIFTKLLQINNYFIIPFYLMEIIIEISLFTTYVQLIRNDKPSLQNILQSIRNITIKVIGINIGVMIISIIPFCLFVIIGYIGYAISKSQLVAILIWIPAIIMLILPIFGDMIVQFSILQIVNGERSAKKAIKESIFDILENMSPFILLGIILIIISIVSDLLILPLTMRFSGITLNGSSFVNLMKSIVEMTKAPSYLVIASIINLIRYPFTKAMFAILYQKVELKR